MRLLICFLTVFMSCCSYGQIYQYLAYDGFSYSPGVSMHGQFGGTGWQEPWEIQTANTSLGYNANSTNLLGYSNLLTQGGFTNGGFQYLSIGRRLDLSNNGPFANFLTSNGKLGKSGTSLYFSFLLRKDQNNDDEVHCMLQGGNNVPWVPNENPRCMMGYFGTNSNVSNLKYWGIQINDVTYLSSKEVVIGEAVLLVCRMDFLSTGCSARFWINPTEIGSTEPLIADIEINTAETLEFLSVAATLGYSPYQASMDEIRIGENYASVTPTSMTPLNSPPIASISLAPNSGPYPLTVSFDGTSSFDPENQLVPQYIWNYGDGTVDTTNLLVVNHQYNDLGIFTPTLKIIDSLGLSHTAYSSLKVTDNNGSYPCLSYVECLSHADCNQNNGSFKVYASGCAYQLFNSQNMLMNTQDTYNIYDSLAPDAYKLYVQSTAGCRDTLHLYIKTDSTTCPGYTIPECINFGINLDGTSYYDRQKVFKNFFHDAAEWLSFNASGSSPWNTEVANEIVKDQNGYPLQIPCMTSIGSQKVRVMISAGGHIQPGQYILKYDGQGQLNVWGGVTTTSSLTGRIEFSVNANYTDNIWIDMNESILGDHIRNIRILRLNHDNDDLSNPFYEEFLNKISPFSTIRFMDVMATNSNYNPQEWNERKNNLYYSQCIESGMSYEYIVQLANISGKNIWINIPHTGNENYVRQMARFFRDNLNCNLDIYVEYSNEVWNWMFPQAHAVSDGEPQNISYARRYAERCRWAFKIWTDEFAGETKRLHRVLNTQSYYPWYGEEILAHLRSDEYDYLSPSWYFSYGGACQNVFDASTSVSEIIDCSRTHFIDMLPTIKKDYRNAALYGKKIVNYEGGQHMTNFSMTPYTPTVWQAQLDPLIYSLYDEVIDTLKKLGTELAIAYNLARVNETVWGSFGHLTDIDMSPTMSTAPKYLALIDNTCSYSTPIVDTAVQFVQTCNSYEWINGVTYTNGTDQAFQTLLNTRGCDSVVRLNLTITPLTVDILPQNEFLTATYTAMDSIAWYDCSSNPNTLIQGATQNIYQPLENGQYAAIVYWGNCSAQSTCETYSLNNLDDNESPTIQIMPNPLTDKCFIIKTSQPIELKMLDTQSKVVWNGSVSGEQFVCIPQLEKGVYLLQHTNGALKIIVI